MLDGLDVVLGEAPVVGQFLPLAAAQLFGGQSPQDVFHHLGVAVLWSLELRHSAVHALRVTASRLYAPDVGSFRTIVGICDVVYV